MKNKLPEIDFERVEILIQLALEEDLNGIGDATSISVIPADTEATALMRCKEDLICAGLPVAKEVFNAVDPDIRFTALVEEGASCPAGSVIAEAEGPARALLTAERTALNFLQRLCGIATTSAAYAAALKDSSTEVLDTRKTTPGWRNLEKYAVAVGGASNHRIGLYDRVMIKDNHRELAGLEGKNGIIRSVRRARETYPTLEVEVEADTLEEVKDAVEAGAEHILLDNMTDAEMADAVRINQGKSKLEASGGITIERLPVIGRLGVDFVSVGALTHSVKASDISMEIKLDKQ
ncbi:carboxylating nicotinate-nucleotide diphosphorylase [Lentisphaerota bacterium ZTH]|nr:carboxylating nicotinate-nucleotide diphosphorylase [Lentisphaerota bacterium]WET06155.1 carboxylating nicotinate-nucleotide diphosphorylase [Lentisphaerota bacterium ZTH]